MALNRPIAFGVIGQSYGSSGYNNNPGYWAFAMALRNLAITVDPTTVGTTLGVSIASTDGVGMLNSAVDGSAIVQANAGGAGYWVADDLVTAGTPLTNAVNKFSGASTKPQIIIYSHGEQEAVKLLTEAASYAPQTAIVNKLLPDVRSACNAGSPTSVPVWIDLLGPRFAGSELAEYWMRDRLLGVIAGGTNIFRGIEKYQGQLTRDTIHPSPATYKLYGAQLGRKVTSWLLGLGELRGPQINTVGVIKSGNQVTIPITVPSGKTLVKPASPRFFGFFDGSDNRIDITSWSAWSGNSITATLASAPSKMRYPAARPASEGDLIDITQIIRLSDPSPALYVGETGLPLESIQTLVL